MSAWNYPMGDADPPEDEFEYDDEKTTCPLCEGVGNPLGELGGYEVFRCRFCGWEWRESTKPEDDGDDYVCCRDEDLAGDYALAWTDPFGEGR